MVGFDNTSSCATGHGVVSVIKGRFLNLMVGFDNTSSCATGHGVVSELKGAEYLKNKLAGLPVNNALEFLANVRKIAREIDFEADSVSAELAVIEESYPKILLTLHDFKQDLQSLREEVCLLRSRYETFVSSFTFLIGKVVIIP
ncbi:hypothetical protein DICVIV_08825 [Dictyocaulus viviparus]|uniref:Uncharacterized protein n=1 Tax=Dictyocaulus viviparus TaxID=29172 RepID=A0A0D8XKQ5_DICVI|nr:hypothetical protein DICVIV_08825 [Dictyocaulus viviparus]